jgi:hypothetical protein
LRGQRLAFSADARVTIDSHFHLPMIRVSHLPFAQHNSA